MPRKKRPKRYPSQINQASGGKRLVQYGKRPMLLGLQPAEREKIQEAARIDGLPMTQFVVAAALAAAQRILDKITKNT